MEFDRTKVRLKQILFEALWLQLCVFCNTVGLRQIVFASRCGVIETGCFRNKVCKKLGVI